MILYKNMSETPYLPDTSTVEGYAAELGLQRAFLSELPELERVAVWGRDSDSDSYRLQVGFAVCAVDYNGFVLPIVGGGNRKHTRHVEKTCAEDVTYARLEEYNPARVLGGLVFATGKQKTVHSVTGIPSHGLLNCQDNCIIKASENPIIAPYINTVHMISMLAETREYEVHTQEEVAAMYREPPMSLNDVPKFYAGTDWGNVLSIFDEVVKKQHKRPFADRIAPHRLVQLALKDVRLRSYRKAQ